MSIKIDIGILGSQYMGEMGMKYLDEKIYKCKYLLHKDSK